MNTRGLVRGRRGVALPVALVGLVAVSLLVTTALLTSSAEFAISSAQTQGARSLYAAESGLQQYLQQLAVNAPAMTPGANVVVNVPTSVSPARNVDVRITTDLLQNTPGAVVGSQNLVYALTAQPLDGGTPRGRSVVAMVRMLRPAPAQLNTNISSAITLGGDLNVNGNAFTVNGRFNGCGVTGGVDAVEASATSSITANHTNHWDNFLGHNDGQNTTGQAAIDRTSMSKEELAQKVLGGQTLEELIAVVPHNRKWGPRFDRPAWNGWLADSVGIAVVDANRGTVRIEGGTGVLIVVNGSIEMRGNAKWDGIIIVEGNFTLSGTPTVQGALVSLAADTGLNTIDLEESAIGSGHITVQFDQCKINMAQEAFANASVPPTPLLSSTAFAWFEVVR